MIIFVEGPSLVQLSKYFLIPREGDAALSGGVPRNGRGRVAGGGGSVDWNGFTVIRSPQL